MSHPALHGSDFLETVHRIPKSRLRCAAVMLNAVLWAGVIVGVSALA